MNIYASKGLKTAPSQFNNDLVFNLGKNDGTKRSVVISKDLYECGESCVFVLESIGYDQGHNTATTV